jgi:hypothetical protein
MAAPGRGGGHRAPRRDRRVLGDHRASPGNRQYRELAKYRSRRGHQRASIGAPRLATWRHTVEPVRAQFVTTGIDQLPLEFASAQHVGELEPDPVVEFIAERLVVTEPVAVA